VFTLDSKRKKSNTNKVKIVDNNIDEKRKEVTFSMMNKLFPAREKFCN